MLHGQIDEKNVTEVDDRHDENQQQHERHGELNGSSP
jgi:hypothetical protein